jgi:hypothetical protein
LLAVRRDLALAWLKQLHSPIKRLHDCPMQGTQPRSSTSN